jgi:hypothetical protein
MRLFLFLYVALLSGGISAQSGNLIPQAIPCLNIDHQSNGIFNGTYYSENCINIGNTNGNTQVVSDQYVKFQAGNEITLLPNSQYKANNQGEIHLKIEKSAVEAVWFSPDHSPGFVGQFNRLEVGFKLPESVNEMVNAFFEGSSSGLNPFDEFDVDFRVKLTAPNGTQTTRFAFYYVPCITNLNSTWDSPNYQNNWSNDTTSYPWRFRFAPDQLGVWNASIEVVRQGTVLYANPAFSFVCVPSEHEGFLKTSHNYEDKDQWMYLSKTGNTFIVNGTNIANTGVTYIPSDAKRQLEAIQQLIAAGGNFVRLELGGQNALPDFPVHNNYIGKMGQMYAFDKIFEECEKHGMYISLFRHHVEVEIGEPWMPVRWEANPYYALLGASIYGYFNTQNSDVQHWQKNNLRYLFSRWGYSANMAFYGYSEFEGWMNQLKDIQPGTNAKDRIHQAGVAINNWIYDQKLYIRDHLNIKNVMYCNTAAALKDSYLDQPSGAPTPGWSPFLHSDIVGLHSYDTEKDMNFNRRNGAKKYWSKYHMPVLFDEVGLNANNNGEYFDIYCCTGIDFHNEVWATALMGNAGAGLNWWWDQIYSHGYVFDLKFIKGFFAGENLRTGNYHSEVTDDALTSNNRKIENYHLVTGNKERVLGWLHNATYYWRNQAGSGTCIQNLINGNQSSNPPCIVIEDPYGYPPNGNQFPWSETDENHHGNLNADFGAARYSDNYSPDGQSVGPNEEYKIKDLKPQPILSNKHHWYRIDYYPTQGSSGWGQVLYNLSAWEHTNLAGNLKPKVPTLDANNPDYAYKVTYLGKYKNQNEGKSNLTDTTALDLTFPQPQIPEWKIYPNPNNGDFTIELAEEMEMVSIYSTKGNLVYSNNQVQSNHLSIALSKCEKGTYLIQIKTKSNIYFSKMVERL